MNEIDFKLIGSKIREIRLEKEYTQEYVAQATGVNVSHISNIETNKVKVSLSLLVHICNALDVTVDYILENTYTKEQSVIEKELMNVMRSMSKNKQETLLRIAKVL